MTTGRWLFLQDFPGFQHYAPSSYALTCALLTSPLGVELPRRRPKELLAIMWKNGYSDQERNAVQFTFPTDYKFHYPELSVMFDIPEEDTYKFCMRTRMEASHIGELDHDATKRNGLIRDHWLAFGTGIMIFKYFPFFNYYFGVKVFGTSMWCYTVWSLMNRFIAKTCRRNEYMAAQKTAQDQGSDLSVLCILNYIIIKL